MLNADGIETIDDVEKSYENYKEIIEDMKQMIES